MLKTELIDPCADNRWDPFVREHPNGLLGHTSAWKEILERSFRHIKAYYIAIVETETNEIKAALPFCQVKSLLAGNRLVSLPFVTQCNPLVRNAEELDILIDAAFDLKERLKCKYVEMKGSDADIVSDNRFVRSSNYRFHCLGINRKPEEISKKFKRQTRQNIRQASERGLEIRKGETEENLKEFYQHYQETRKRNLLPSPPYRFFSLIWDRLRPSGCIELLQALHKKEPVGGIILFKYKDQVSGEFLGTSRASAHLRPNHILIWHAIKKSHEEGYSLFDFGRTACDNAGLIKFKESWGSSRISLFDYIGPGITVNGSSNRNPGKLKLMNTLIRLTPQRAYGKISDLIYSQFG